MNVVEKTRLLKMDPDESSLCGDMKPYSRLNIPNVDKPTYTIQPASEWTDLHTDMDHGLLLQQEGSKAWVAFQRMSLNERIFYDMHETTSNCSFLCRRTLAEMEGGR